MFSTLSRVSSSTLPRFVPSSLLLRPSSLSRSFAAAPAAPPAGAGGRGGIGKDGKHEIWRDGIYDHDNEPK